MAQWSELHQAEALRAYLGTLIERPTFGVDEAIAAARATNMYRVEHLASALIGAIGLKVQSGPFRNMQLVPVQMGSLLMPKLLGTYESEISHLFEDLSAFDRVVDIGSAEGYYAVGCPFANPHLRSIAYDADVKAHAVCRQAAERNGVSDRVEQRHFCSFDELASLADARTLIVIDIDGAEVDLLCSQTAERLARATIIMEVHQVGSTTTEADIIPHFARTHDIQIFRQGVVDANRFAFLRQLTAFERYLTVWEGRKTEAWLHMTPKGQA